MAQARQLVTAGKSEASDVRTRILDAAVDQLRRHGPAKTGVVDVARALGISHAAVYRYFASKDELFDAVAERWLTAVSSPLKAIAARQRQRRQTPGSLADRVVRDQAAQGHR